MNYLRKSRLLASLCLLLSLAIGATAHAGDLYGPQAAADAAWLRVINATETDLNTRVAGTELSLAFAEASAYLLVDPGEVVVALADAELAVAIEPGQFLTVAQLPAETLVIQEPVIRDISRGLLGLLNLTGQSALALLTPAGDTVVSEVAPGEATSLAINAATTALEVHAADGLFVSVPEQVFERGVAYTVAVLDGPEGPLIVLLEAGTD